MKARQKLVVCVPYKIRVSNELSEELIESCNDYALEWLGFNLKNIQVELRTLRFVWYGAH